ncbi:MAG TPA: ATP-binding protein [Chitinophagaceae bacterium]|nr:ATP-binding protein [Chitinophagaceae bacterium]
MPQILRILHLEDLKSDAELIERELKKGTFDFEKVLVDNRQSYLEALQGFEPDIVISDHSLPSFNSIEALGLLHELKLDIPFILVTATISEEFAVDMIKMGAADYILKDRLQRLPNAIINAIDKNRLEKERQKSEANLKTIFNNTDTAYVLFTPQQQVVSFNNQAVQFVKDLFGKELKSGSYAADYFSEKRMPFINHAFEAAGKGESVSYENSFFSNNDEVKWYYSRWFGTMNSEKINLGAMLAISDITQRKLSELKMEKMVSDIMQRNNAFEQFAFIVSHNLRSPAANIMALTDMLTNWSEGDDDEAEKQAFLKALYMSAKKLDDVILDLNHILRITQRVNEKKEIVYFLQLVNDIQSALEADIKKEAVVINTNFTEVMNIYTLKSYLYSIFFNLISNSINFKRPFTSPVIKITSYPEGSNICLVFNDNGKGIDLAKFGKKIFGLYQRFDNTVDGRGVGLSMVKTQVEALGGTITVESILNKGTTFTIKIPA